MNPVVIAFGRNLGIFLVAYPISILPAFLISLITIRIFCLLNAYETCIVHGPIDVLAIGSSLAFIVILALFFSPCIVLFFFIKTKTISSRKIYFSAGILIALILCLGLAMTLSQPFAGSTYYYELAATTLDLLAIVTPGAVAGALVFHAVEQKMLRHN